MVKNNLKNTTSGKKIDFPIPVSSYKMILIGFGFVFWAIMRKPKKEMEEGTKD